MSSTTISGEKRPATAVPYKKVRNTVPLKETARLISEATAEVSAVQVLPPPAVCKTTAGETTHFDVRADEIVQLDPASVCKTTESNTHNRSACRTAEAANKEQSVCKTTESNTHN